MTNEMLALIDAEIKKLTQARALLAGTSNSSRGRRKKGTMSPEGRARIAAAQRKRWAKAKRAGK